VRDLILISSLALALTACGSKDVEAPVVPEVETVEGFEVVTPPEVPEIMNVSDIDFSSYSLDLAKFVGLEIGEAKEISSQKIKAYFAPEKGAQGNATYEFSEFGAIGGYVMLSSSDGIADDSIKGQELYAVFKDEKLVTYGMKIKCWRGENKDNWQTDLCP